LALLYCGLGIISRRDILRTVVRTDDIVQMDVHHRLDEYAGGARVWTTTVSGGVVTIVGRTPTTSSEG
jgi:hypothetical protein